VPRGEWADVSAFCPECDVTLDFHDGPDSCEDAQDKAAALEDMERMMFGRFFA
jgi:hypothetical protein